MEQNRIPYEQNQKKYANVYDLIADDSCAQAYYMSLPDYVQGQIESRADGVNSFASLQDYAENLLRGDD
ncbi:MAG: hypothetical protein ACI4PQ_02595 [Butyricicoccaceae bacterium]